MKKIFLFCTRIAVYWVELPLIILFAVCVANNAAAENLLKLYPLMILTVLGMLFILIYFFRVIEISYSEIRYIGLFSSRDSAMIDEGKTLILKEMGRGRVKITLFGNDGVHPEFSWLESTGDAPRDISLFRGKTIGGKRSIKRILKYFGATPEDFPAIFEGGFSSDSELVSITSEKTDGLCEIKIRINKTV